MIVRILGEGQWDVEESLLEVLNALDAVRSQGTRLEDDSLEDSDLILPPSDATLDEVRAMLTDEGLVPDQ